MLCKQVKNNDKSTTNGADKVHPLFLKKGLFGVTLFWNDQKGAFVFLDESRYGTTQE